VAPGSAISRTLAEIAIQAAWGLRESEPEKSREIVALVREADPELPFLVHLEGYFLVRDGSRQEAEAKFERLIELTKIHTEQTLLGLAFYGDGFRDHAFSMFKRLIACGCETSAEAFEHVLTYLGERNDREAARELCLWALGRDEYDDYIVADMLREAGRPEWAREFSQRLIETPGADEEDYFLHFLVLNDMGNPSETIEFAKVMKSRFMAGEHYPAAGTFMDDVLKELKRKGRVSLYG
jgi:tetratricopeptide (TPR) repeat protein